MTQLIPATDRHFAWLLGESPPLDNLRQAPGGVEQRGILKWLRAVSSRLEAMGHLGSFLIVDQGEVVGLCGFKGRPDETGAAEIGYGVAPSRRRKGYATKAVSLICEAARKRPELKALIAETSVDNPASQRALESGGFLKVGTRRDTEDGDLVLWAKPLVPEP